MPSGYRLQPLLQLRQQAEEEAGRVLRAAGERLRAVELEQQHLRETAAEARRRQQVARQMELFRPGELVRAADAAARRRLDARLADVATAARRAADEHRDGVLAAARLAEGQARRAYDQARCDREALDKHRERLQQESRRKDARRSERQMDELAEVAHRQGEETGDGPVFGLGSGPTTTR